MTAAGTTHAKRREKGWRHKGTQLPRDTTKTHLQHGDVLARQLRPLLVKVVPVLEEPVAVALVKQVPVAASILLKLGCGCKAEGSTGSMGSGRQQANWHCCHRHCCCCCRQVLLLPEQSCIPACCGSTCSDLRVCPYNRSILGPQTRKNRAVF